MMSNFNNYLIVVGRRAELDFYLEDDYLFRHIDYFRECFNQGMSPYKALTFLTVKDE